MSSGITSLLRASGRFGRPCTGPSCSAVKNCCVQEHHPAAKGKRYWSSPKALFGAQGKTAQSNPFRSGIPGTESSASLQEQVKGGKKARHRQLLHPQHIQGASGCGWGEGGNKGGMRGNRRISDRAGKPWCYRMEQEGTPGEGAWDQV